jgi:hypothetical protein
MPGQSKVMCYLDCARTGDGRGVVSVGTLQNGYLRKVPLPRVPRHQSTSLAAVAATSLVNPCATGYLPDTRISIYNNLCRLLLDTGKQCLPLRLVG